MTSNIKKIIIDPRCRINYSSYYIEGLRNLFGSRMIEYRCLQDFNTLPSGGMAVKIVADGVEKRVFFDCWDGDSINEDMYQWADAYGKVNLRPDDSQRDKVVPMGPNFGISLWNPVSTMIKGVEHYRIIKRDCGGRFKQPLKSFIRDYAYMFVRRKRYGYYHRLSDEEQQGYFFSMSTLWWGDLSINTTNRYRGDFMRLCKKHMDSFEGGFVYIPAAEKESKVYSNYQQEYSDMIYQSRLSMAEYDKRNRMSWFVFSTPSVIGCHGWKLGEFLCEGKAIVSTPLNNVMPGNFENGVHYLEVTSPQEMEEAIIRLRDDANLVKQLKRNAWDYFNEWVSPEASVRHVLAKAGINL